jgi:hypothetical protein
MPGVIPVTLPPLFTVPIAVLLLDHVPPVPLANRTLKPTQTPEPPVIGVGAALTVTVIEAEQPIDAMEYVMSEVPGDTPVRAPVLPKVATLVVLLLHVPPAGLADKVDAIPMQIVVLPEKTGSGLTTIGFIALHPAEFV